ncbi:MAG: 50S ribosomal protein L9 [Pyrinomonadaceae bacterium]|nr:50S ribosomal protein L9 [Pyrinomonadaceae bacterium]
MATTQILLREDIDNLGGRGEIVKVKAGFARNYLLPRGYAIPATKGNIKQVEQERVLLLKKAAEEKSTAEAQLEQMKDISFNFERKAGESGTLFGSVTSIDVANALMEKGYEIDRRNIRLKHPIKEIGDYNVPVKLHRDVILDIPISVTVEGEAIQEKLEEEPAPSEQEGPAADGESDTQESVDG